MTTAFPSRDAPLNPQRTCIIVIDTQKGIFNQAASVSRPYFYKAANEIVVPNIARLITAARQSKTEVMYTVIESLTHDGRDRSLDYKQSNFHFAPGSIETEVIDELRPGSDDITLPKTSSSLFNSTIFEYLLRNMGIDTVVATGFLTDQCIDHTVRDGADRGFRMVCPVDTCTTDTDLRHTHALSAFKGYCRQTDTATLIAELLSAGK